jgi:hypothetical protein
MRGEPKVMNFPSIEYTIEMRGYNIHVIRALVGDIHTSILKLLPAIEHCIDQEIGDIFP